MIETLGLFVLLAGFVIGLGAVTVIDLHGFLGRKSPYWTEATVRTHKVTKPLIWFGFILVVIGGVVFYWGESFMGVPLIHAISLVILIFNGLFLSFVVSPYLLEQERRGESGKLLPASLQRKITISFLISFIGWWGNLALLVWYLHEHM